MPGLFERLKAELDADDHGGITPLEIAELPDAERRLMLWLLRDRTASSEGVTVGALIEQMPAAPADAATVVAALARDGWLIALGEPPDQRYKVNLRRKRGSTLGFGLWTILSERLTRDLGDSR